MQKQPILNHDHCIGHQSSLEAMNDVIVKIVLAMGQICQYLNPFSGLSLVNPHIEGESIHQQLIDLKMKYSSNTTEIVGKNIGLDSWKEISIES